jgi:hypothetical protein
VLHRDYKYVLFEADWGNVNFFCKVFSQCVGVLGTMHGVLGTMQWVLHGKRVGVLGTMHGVLGTMQGVLGTIQSVLGTIHCVLGTMQGALGIMPGVLGSGNHSSARNTSSLIPPTSVLIKCVQKDADDNILIHLRTFPKVQSVKFVLNCGND